MAKARQKQTRKLHQILRNMRRVREDYEYTQEHMAELMGMKAATYQRFENGGNRVIDYEKVEKFAFICGLELIDLIELHTNFPYPPEKNPILVQPGDDFVEYSPKTLSKETYVSRIQDLKAHVKSLLNRLAHLGRSEAE